MGFTELKQIPGIDDVNDTFSEKNLERTKERYDELTKVHGYHFGDLTASFCNLTPEEHFIWHKVIDDNYPFDIQQEMMRTIEAALSHKDKDGHDAPVPVEFRWTVKLAEGQTQGIKTTYASLIPSYLIEIFGYPSPMRMLLTARRAGEARAE